ncbi:MAG: acyl-homoserine-lactone synthase [Pseudomonadota bacterium]
MVQIITRANRDQHASLLEDMYRHRYRILVEQMGWNIPGIEPGYDYDAFDTDRTIYLIETHPHTGKATASIRFNPTTAPHLMSEVFANQCEFQGVPVADDIWEVSRMVYDSDRMGGELFRRTRGLFLVAITEFAIQSGIRAISWVVRKSHYATLIQFWPTTPLGLPKYFAEDDAEYISAVSQMNEAALAGVRRRRGDDALVFPYGIPSDLILPGTTPLLRAG